MKLVKELWECVALVFWMVLAAFYAAGCSTISLEAKNPDGTSLKLVSNSFIINRGIQEGEYGGLKVKGYHSDSNADFIKAAADGAAAGAVRAATPVP